jgi:hypothetical protein
MATWRTQRRIFGVMLPHFILEEAFTSKAKLLRTMQGEETKVAAETLVLRILKLAVVMLPGIE